MGRRGLLGLGGVAFLGLLIWPETVLGSLRDAVTVCAEVLIPSLFPFLILTGLLTEAGIGRFALLGGFPVAARTYASECARGGVTPEAAALRVCVLTCSGPAFVLTGVGVGMCGSPPLGWLLLIGQWTAAGILYTTVLLLERRKRPGQTSAPLRPVASGTFSLSETLVNVTRSSAGAMGMICACVLVFAAVTALLESSGFLEVLSLLPGDRDLWTAAVTGSFEVTLGCRAASACAGVPSVLLLSFLLGFGGLSVMAQVRALAPELPLRHYLPLRLLFGVLAAAVTGLLLPLLPESVPAFAPAPGRSAGSYIGSVALLVLCTALICKKKERIPAASGFGTKPVGYNTSGIRPDPKNRRK